MEKFTTLKDENLEKGLNRVNIEEMYDE